MLRDAAVNYNENKNGAFQRLLSHGTFVRLKNLAAHNQANLLQNNTL